MTMSVVLTNFSLSQDTIGVRHTGGVTMTVELEVQPNTMEQGEALAFADLHTAMQNAMMNVGDSRAVLHMLLEQATGDRYVIDDDNSKEIAVPVGAELPTGNRALDVG